MRTCVVVLGLLLAGCATRNSPAAATPPPLPSIDVAALIRHGCFHCLERALTAATGEQRFEVAALLTLRAKELGLPYGEFRSVAEASAATNPLFATYLQLLDGMPVDPLTGARYLVSDPGGASASRADRAGPGVPVRVRPGDRALRWREALRSGAGSDLFRRYLELAIDCSLMPRTEPDAAPLDRIAADDSAPLLRYRTGLCGNGADDLHALRRDDPEFVDADLTLGRYAMRARPADLDEGLRWIASAHAAFPESIVITASLAEVYERREEWTEALARFDDVLARMPEHRDALLGQTVALSNLKRHDDAIATATQMIDLGSWFLGEAHYWRAWNAFALQRYPAARVDADRARSLMVNAAVFVLSGLIEWNEVRLPTAESEFEEALNMDFGRCDAARYLGRVRMQRSKAPEALAAFKQAIQCFDLSITVRNKAIADIQAGPGSEATKARLAAGHQRAIDAARKDREECVQNAAALEARGTQ